MAHGWCIQKNVESMRLKYSETTLCHIKNCKLKKTFPNFCKKSNVVPIQKKKEGEKDIMKNYRPVSLLLMFGKIFERVI